MDLKRELYERIVVPRWVSPYPYNPDDEYDVRDEGAGYSKGVILFHHATCLRVLHDERLVDEGHVLEIFEILLHIIWHGVWHT